MKTETSIIAKLDEEIRARMQKTGESYEDAAKVIGDYNVERVRVVAWLRMCARYYEGLRYLGDSGCETTPGVDAASLIEGLATRIEEGEHS